MVVRDASSIAIGIGGLRNAGETSMQRALLGMRFAIPDILGSATVSAGSASGLTELWSVEHTS
jgi:hypothetical protein